MHVKPSLFSSIIWVVAAAKQEVGGLIFAGYVPLASQSPYPIIHVVYSVVNYRLHLSHF